MRPERAADHSHPSSAAFMEEYSYTSTHPLGHTGPVTGSLYIFYLYIYIYIYIYIRPVGNIVYVYICIHIHIQYFKQAFCQPTVSVTVDFYSNVTSSTVCQDTEVS